jgi:hypothetical protein
MRMYIALALYGGPDQLMPITSGLTAIFAILLIFWNKVLVMAGRFLKLLSRASAHSTPGQSNQPIDTAERERVEGPRPLG